MTVLQTAKAITRMRSRFVLATGAGLIGLLGMFGCGTTPSPTDDMAPQTITTPLPGSNDPSWLTSREKLPPPDTDRMDYDAKDRTLNLYDLPNRDTWMVQLPNESVGHLVGPQHRLPEGVDTTHTLVYYARAGMKVSMPVTVAQIEAGRMAHPSLAIGGQ